jgi:hypothetical protein
MRKSVRRALGVGVVGGFAYTAWRAWNARVPPRAQGGVEWSTAPFPFPPVPSAASPASATKPAAPQAATPKAATPKAATPKAATPKAATPKAATPKAATAKPATPQAATQKSSRARASAWVEPKADGTCPPTHPIKAKMASGIFHAPGGANYARTKPDRCYVDAAAATADGLRPAKA